MWYTFILTWCGRYTSTVDIWLCTRPEDNVEAILLFIRHFNSHSDQGQHAVVQIASVHGLFQVRTSYTIERGTHALRTSRERTMSVSFEKHMTCSMLYKQQHWEACLMLYYRESRLKCLLVVWFTPTFPVLKFAVYKALNICFSIPIQAVVRIAFVPDLF